MQGQQRGEGHGAYYLVLNRSCADLYDEIADLFADRPYIKVVVDRRRGKSGMTEIPTFERSRSRQGQGRVKSRAA